MRFSKIVPLFSIILVLLILLVSFALAQRLEVEYPQLGQRPVSQAELKEFPQYVQYIFYFAIAIAGLIAFASLVYGGFRYLTSAGSPEAARGAREQITAGILGLIILLASFLILRTINPQLIILKVEPVTARMGIILCQAPTCSPEILKDPNAVSGKNYLVVKSNRSCLEPCEPTESGFTVGSIYFYESSDEVIVELYEQKNYKPEPPIWTSIDKDISGYSSVAVGVVARSVKLTWKAPGVYLFSTNECGETGNPETEVHYFGPGGVPTFSYIDFNDKARSIKIVPRVEREKKWDVTKCPGVSIPPGVCADRPDCCRTEEIVKEKLGAILYENENYEHSATVWLGGEPDDPKAHCISFDDPAYQNCSKDKEPYCTENISKKASSIFVFRQAIKKPANWSDWGEGVTIFEHAEMNEQQVEAGKGAKYCGPINIGSPKIAGRPRPQPILVDGKWEAGDIGGSHPILEYGNELNCGSLLAEWDGSYKPDPLTGLLKPDFKGDGEEISSIKVEGNYLGLLLKKDGRGEFFAPPGNYNLKISHIGNDDADYLLVIPTQP